MAESRQVIASKFRGMPRQRGAISIFAALTLLLALAFTALAVDAGRLWMEKRKLQKVADMAALETARNVGCGGGGLGNNFTAIAQAAAMRNGYMGNLGNTPNRVEIGWITTSNGMRQFSLAAPAGDPDEDAVYVRATHEIPASLVVGGLAGRTILMMAEATARAEPPQAHFSIGSKLLDLSSKDGALLNALLGGLLGSSLDLELASWRGLAGATVNLADLVRASIYSSTEQLLSASLTVVDVLEITAHALGQQSVLDLDIRNGMESILTANLDSLDVRLGEVINVAMPSTDAAVHAAINVLDLITTTAMVANTRNLVDLDIGIPGIASVKLTLWEPPQLAVGPAGYKSTGGLCTEAKTAQAYLDIPVLDLLSSALLDAKIHVELAHSRARLEELDIGAGSAHARIGTTPGIVKVKLQNNAGTGPAKLHILGLSLVDIGLNLDLADPSAGPLDFDIDYPHPDLPQSKKTFTSLGGSLHHALSQPDILTVDGGLLGGLLGALGLGGALTELINVLAPLLSQVGEVILDPLLKVLGLELGGAEVTLDEVTYGQGAELVI